jgi:hypothetical protein
VITSSPEARAERHACVAAARIRVELLLDQSGWRWNAAASKILDRLVLLAEEEDAS